ncbi:helix-turn-helix domain-containing protein [Enterococcus sp. 669A]|uniref:Helix-turn-helix domain-containing protein n=1 Tax=Candidatus Enterococcus moelleringii TaxID=2815325 RepID=A0ABS3L4S1_9ENTE|nr:helix-turn-helix domain-containing protein [Enterococcus sp. 669A]MBO1304619.1 helix-turn-helix domain-containing protein [Enterococcus sp. 669A]
MDLRQLTKQETLRRLRLVEALYYSENALTNEQLMDVGNCSLPVLLKDIKELNEKKLPITILKFKSLYFLKFESSTTIDSVYSYILSTSIEYRLIEQLFFQRQEKIAKLADHFGCSLANVQRNLKFIENTLPVWNIHLRYRPLRIEGDEVMIRYFYYLFFKERRFPLQDYGFSEKLVELIDRYIRAFLSENQVGNSMHTHFYLMHSFLICLHRRKLNYCLDEPLPHDHFFRLPEKAEHSDLVNQLLLECRLNYSPDLIMEALWPLFSDNLVLTCKQQFHQRTTNYKLADFYDLHTQLMKSINLALGNTLTDTEIQEGLRHLGNDVLVYYPNEEGITILAKPQKYALKLLKKSYSRAINRLSRIIHTFLKTNYLLYSEEQIELYLSSLIISIDGLLERLTEMEQPIRVLLISDASANQERFWRSMLTSLVHAPLHFSFFSFPYINQRDLNQTTKKYDLIITDVTMLELDSSCPVIAVNSYPTPQDVAAIQIFFDEFDALPTERKEMNHEPALSS